MEKYAFLVIGVVIGILVISGIVSAGWFDFFRGEQKSPATPRDGGGTIAANSCNADNTCEVNEKITLTNRIANFVWTPRVDEDGTFLITDYRSPPGEGDRIMITRTGKIIVSGNLILREKALGDCSASNVGEIIYTEINNAGIWGMFYGCIYSNGLYQWVALHS